MSGSTACKEEQKGLSKKGCHLFLHMYIQTPHPSPVKLLQWQLDLCAFQTGAKYLKESKRKISKLFFWQICTSISKYTINNAWSFWTNEFPGFCFCFWISIDSLSLDSILDFWLMERKKKTYMHSMTGFYIRYPWSSMVLGKI